MKTYEEFIDEVVTEEYKRINPVAMNIHKNAAKEYAKQWVDRAANITANHFTSPTLTILNLKKEIDAQ